MPTYAVVASDPLRSLFDKGEVKDRYWNPCGVFDQVHVLVFADRDIEASRVQKVAGSARLTIHPMGPLRLQDLWRLRSRVRDTLEAIEPDVIRGHGPFLQGYYAVYGARRLGVPCFVSIHDDVSMYRRLWTYGEGYLRMTAYQLMLKALGWERYIHRHADRLVPKYRAAGRLLMASRYRSKVQVIYNEVFLESFTDMAPSLAPGDRLRIINVGRQFAGKDQRPLIEALREVDAELTLIGTGPLRPKLVRTAARCGVSDRVRFIDSVPNHELPGHYRGHHVFAMNISQPGVSMTVMEAMALGFPIIINRPRWEDSPEVSGEAAYVVQGGAKGFGDAFSHFCNHPELVRIHGRRSRETIARYSGEEMERQEADLVRDLMAGRDPRGPS